MRDIIYTTGDATAPEGAGHKIIAHICNDIGGWGKGFVVAISRKWPEPESDYRRWYAARDRNDFGLGAVRVVSVADDVSVANMIGRGATANSCKFMRSLMSGWRSTCCSSGLRRCERVPAAA